MSKTSKTNYKLTYFEVRARGELCRMVLHAAGQEFQDVRITFEEWPKLKPSTPTGVLPVLEINSDKLCQSMAIARYLAKQYGFYGKTDRDGASIDQVIDTVGDLMGTLISWKLESDATKQAEKNKNIIEETGPRFIRYFDNFLKGKDYFVGSSLTIADMAVYDVLVTLLKKDAKCLSKYPKLEANYKRVGEHPKLKKYLEKRPDIDI